MACLPALIGCWSDQADAGDHGHRINKDVVHGRHGGLKIRQPRSIQKALAGGLMSVALDGNLGGPVDALWRGL